MQSRPATVFTGEQQHFVPGCWLAGRHFFYLKEKSFRERMSEIQRRFGEAKEFYSVKKPEFRETNENHEGRSKGE